MAPISRLLFACLVAVMPLLADRPAVVISVQLESTGEMVATTSGADESIRLDQVIGAVLGCKGRAISADDLWGRFRCASGLRRRSVTLEGTLHLGPIARQLDPAEEIEVRLEHPVLGFEEVSPSLQPEFRGRRQSWSTVIAAGAAKEPIRIRFGYRYRHLLNMYAPLLGLAVILIVVTAVLRRRGMTFVQPSIYVIGSILWLAAVWQLRASEPLQILTGGITVAAFMNFLPPLLCVATGAALAPGGRFQETFWGFGQFAIPLASVLTAIPLLVDGRLPQGAPWIVLALASILWSRRRILSLGGGRMRQLSNGRFEGPCG